MTQRTEAEALRALSQGSEHRSKIGRMRSIFEEIEAAQRAGVSNSAILKTLNDQGYNLSLKSFETMIYRIRKERGINQDSPPANAGHGDNHGPEEQQPSNASTSAEPEASPQEGVSEVHKILTQPIVKYPPRKK